MPTPGGFRYTKTVLSDDTAVLEFETTIEDKYVNGVDIIRCNREGRIIEFRVMIRPLQAVNLVHAQMAAAVTHADNKILPVISSMSAVLSSADALPRTTDLSLARSSLVNWTR